MRWNKRAIGGEDGVGWGDFLNFSGPNVFHVVAKHVPTKYLTITYGAHIVFIKFPYVPPSDSQYHHILSHIFCPKFYSCNYCSTFSSSALIKLFFNMSNFLEFLCLKHQI
jgi:hypothetical protein